MDVDSKAITRCLGLCSIPSTTIPHCPCAGSALQCLEVGAVKRKVGTCKVEGATLSSADPSRPVDASLPLERLV